MEILNKEITEKVKKRYGNKKSVLDLQDGIVKL